LRFFFLFIYLHRDIIYFMSSEEHKLAASCAALWAALSLKLNFGCSWAYKLELEAQAFRWKRSSRFASSSGFWASSSAHFKLTLKILSKMDFSQNFTKIFNHNLTHKLLFGTIWANPAKNNRISFKIITL
jgi:hypothetical protein